MNVSAPSRPTAPCPKHCMKCNYDLRVNPPKGVCPECGTPYHATIFAIPLEDGSGSGIGLIAMIVLALLFLVSLIRAVREGEFLAAAIIALITAAIVHSTFMAIRSNKRHERGLSVHLVGTERGLCWVKKGQKGLSYPWHHFTDVQVLRRRGRLWLFRLHERIPGKGRTRTNELRVLFKADKRDAARLRNEIRRRILKQTDHAAGQ